MTAAAAATADKEELQAALEKLKEMGFTNINDVDMLKRSADEKLTGTADEARMLAQLQKLTDHLQRLAGDGSAPPSGGCGGADVDFDRLMKQVWPLCPSEARGNSSGERTRGEMGVNTWTPRIRRVDHGERMNARGGRGVNGPWPHHTRPRHSSKPTPAPSLP